MPIVEATVLGRCKRKHPTEAEAARPGDAEAGKNAVDAMELDTTPTAWADKIVELKKNTAEARKYRQKLAKELKAAQRKNKRLKERARLLSEEDMVQILVMKRGKTASEKEEVASSASSSSKSDTYDKSPQKGPADGKKSPEEEDAAGMQDVVSLR